jgi:putative transposase
MPLFTRPQTVDIIPGALKYRQENHGWKIYGMSSWKIIFI